MRKGRYRSRGHASWGYEELLGPTVPPAWMKEVDLLVERAVNLLMDGAVKLVEGAIELANAILDGASYGSRSRLLGQSDIQLLDRLQLSFKKILVRFSPVI